jgi:hypothetical protein
MAEGKSIARNAISILLLIATGLGLYNVFSDNKEVRVQAETLACGKPSCAARITRESRNPIGQSFEFQVSDSATPASVDCRLSFFLLGEWRCEKTGGPATAPSATPSATKR